MLRRSWATWENLRCFDFCSCVFGCCALLAEVKPGVLERTREHRDLHIVSPGSCHCQKKNSVENKGTFNHRGKYTLKMEWGLLKGESYYRLCLHGFTLTWGMCRWTLAHNYNSSYSIGRGLEDCIRSKLWPSSLWDPISKSKPKNVFTVWLKH
jgi:hypothetical protein